MTKFLELSGPMQAVVWMLGQCTCFAIMALSARALSTSMSAYEMIFFRAVFGFLFMLRSAAGRRSKSAEPLTAEAS